MKILLPGFACVVSPGFEKDPDNEFDLAISKGYCRIFIESPTGLLLHQNLTPGKDGVARFVRLPIASLPDGRKPMSISPALNFLPAGKVPIELLLQVQAFFKGVMARHKQKLEAMIWIVWNQDQGYHLIVPKQVVGAASARYEWGDIPEGTIVVVDIHSHADMGAFFSGTDNGDDSNTVRYSGVIGHNSRSVPEMLFRFNFLGKFLEQKVEDIFCLPQPTVEAPPDEWYDKISLSGHYQGGHQGAYQGQIPSGQGYPFQGQGQPVRGMDGGARRTPTGWSYRATEEGGIQDGDGDEWFTSYGPGRRVVSPGGPVDGQSVGLGPVRETSAGLVTAVETGVKAPNLRRVPGPKGEALAKIEGRVFPSNGSFFFTDGENLILPFDKASGKLIEFPDTEVVELTPEETEQRALDIDARANTLRSIVERCLSSDPQVGDFGSVEIAARRQAQEELLSESPLAGEDLGFKEDPRFDTMAINHGLDAATAYLHIEEIAPHLANAEELLCDSVASMFELVEGEARLRLFRNIAETLTESEKDDLAQNGL